MNRAYTRSRRWDLFVIVGLVLSIVALNVDAVPDLLQGLAVFFVIYIFITETIPILWRIVREMRQRD